MCMDGTLWGGGEIGTLLAVWCALFVVASPVVGTAGASGVGPQSVHAGSDAGTTVPSSANTTVNASETSPSGAGNATSVSSSQDSATIRGRVMYQNETGAMVPARHVDVIIRKSVVPFDWITQTTTNESGYYSTGVDVASFESNLDPDETLTLRVQALAQNDAVNVVNFARNLDTVNGNTWTINNDGTINVGEDSATFDFSITGQDERRAFQIANWSLQVYEFTERETGWTRNRVKARYPAAVDENAQFKSPLEKFVIGSGIWGRSDTRNVVHHEYSHSVMSGLFGYAGWQAPDVSTWFGSHCIWMDTGRIYAWYEGFAQFMEAAAVDDPGVHVRSIETFQFYDDDQLSTGDCPAGDTGDFDGHDTEGAIANILWDVYDPANESHDRLDGSLHGVFNAVNETDNRAWGRTSNNGRTVDIHDFFIQYVDNNPNRHEELRRIYFEYGINKPDRFESRTGASCPLHEYPCDKLDGQYFSPVQPNRSVNVGLHHQDVDTFRFDAEEEQRVTVNVTVTNSPPVETEDLRLTVNDTAAVTPRERSIGTRTENGRNETVVFTAREDGTYYVTVDDEVGEGNVSYQYSVNATQVDQTNEEDDTPAEATGLSFFELSGDRWLNTSLETAATARYDHDYYEVDLLDGERIYNATLSDGPGLTMTLEDDSGPVGPPSDPVSVANGEKLNTTTEVDGVHYLNVSGDARVEEYDVNVTTQRISQKYEENDGQSAAADLTADLGFDEVPELTDSPDGTLACRGGQGDGDTGGNTETPSFGTGSDCPRFNWEQTRRATAGYEPYEADWYYVTMAQHERLNVTVDDPRLGIELFHGGQKIAETNSESLTRRLPADGDYYVNVTQESDDYIPTYTITAERTLADARDRLEPNDVRTNATTVSTATSGTSTESYERLSITDEDVDLFAVDPGSGEDINVTLTHEESVGDVGLTVIEPGGATVSGSEDPVLAGTSGTGLRANLTDVQSGTHYVRVTASGGAALKYNLSVRTTGSASSNVIPIAPIGLGVIDPVVSIDLEDLIVLEETPQPPQLDTGACELYDTESRSRTIPISGGQDQRVERTRSFTVDYDDPCKLVARVDAPEGAEVDVYVTLGGRTPTPNDYDFAAEGPGNAGELTVDGPLARGMEVQVLVQATPVAGDYEVFVEKYARSGG